uniref:Integrase catalytic domain-containing protein n=1 Tax=Stegastes partitus TaxID=144197 RepID=A0A3B5A6B9_9TELE
MWTMLVLLNQDHPVPTACWPHVRLLQFRQVLPIPFQKVAADITELPVTSQGNRYALVITDYFRRYANLFPMKDQRAVTVAKIIFEDYVRQHGVPESIHTDQGRQFESDLIKHLCQLLGITKTRTTPYHSQSDGMVERLNRTLKDQLAKYIAQTGGEWDQFLPQVELAYNSSVHSSTGFSPFFLVHGREPNLPLDVILNCSPTVTSPTPGTPAAYATYLTSCLTHAFAGAAHTSALRKLCQKSQYDKKVVFHPHEPGDLVLLDDPAQKMNKLAPRWKGPFVILKRMTKDGHPSVTYEITDPRKAHSRTWIVHHNRLKCYKGTFITSAELEGKRRRRK